MKIILLSYILFVLLSLEVKAQNCKSPCPYYDTFISMAQADTVKNTQTKLNYYRAAIVAAKDCNCPVSEQDANEEIDKLFEKIEAQKKRAEAQAQIIIEQQNKVKAALKKTEEANKKNTKIVEAMDFYDGKFALAFKNGKYGFIDKDGNTKLDFEYDKGGPFDAETGFAEMEMKPENSNEKIKYLIDTIGNRYQLFDVSEEYLTLQENESTEKQESKSTNGTSSLALINGNLNNIFNKNKEKIALNVQDVDKKSALKILKYLAENIETKNRVGVLIWGEEDLELFPDIITEFKNLENIDIYWTAIKSIPNTIDRLENLKKIKLPTTIKTLPSSFYNLKRLEVVDLSDIELKTLSEIGNLKTLKELHLPFTLELFPESLGDLENLEILDLYFTKVKEIPEAIGKLKKLRSLELPSRLRTVSAEVYSLDQLEYLTLSGTEEIALPEAIGNLKKLRELLVEMPLETIPPSIYNLEQLEILNLWKARLTTFPEGIDNLKKLKILYVSRGLKMLPESISKLRNIKELNLYETRIKNLPKDFFNLKSLEYLSLPPSLEELPEGLSNLVNLEKFNIRYNQNLKGIPDISQLKNLEDFYYIIFDDEAYFSNLKKLKALQKELPNCNFEIRNEEEERVDVK